MVLWVADNVCRRQIIVHFYFRLSGPPCLLLCLLLSIRLEDYGLVHNVVWSHYLFRGGSDTRQILRIHRRAVFPLHDVMTFPPLWTISNTVAPSPFHSLVC